MIGQFLGQYRIDAQLGAGAMGVVYRAYDTRLHRTVAIKRLQNAAPEVSGPQLLGEARAAATLNHPNICTIHEVGEVDGHAFIVMEYVDGKTLSDLIPERGLPLETVLEYGGQIADAVAFAHAGGIVHRDLKSSNIVITREGRPKVLDFGLALRVPSKSINELSASLATSAPTNLDVAGTPHYMSPEAHAWRELEPAQRRLVARYRAVRDGHGSSPVRRADAVSARGARVVGLARRSATQRRAAAGRRDQALPGQAAGAALPPGG